MEHWRAVLHLVQTDTVIAWHRRGFRLFWRWKSRHRTGRPEVPQDVRALISKLSSTVQASHFRKRCSASSTGPLFERPRSSFAAKRPATAMRVTLDDRIGAAYPRDCELLLLDHALDELARRDARQGQTVELRYFGGLSDQDVADVLRTLADDGDARQADRARVALST
jgi:DNA-directed RNA polymerase specialized sigma24 family protein